MAVGYDGSGGFAGARARYRGSNTTAMRRFPHSARRHVALLRLFWTYEGRRAKLCRRGLPEICQMLPGALPNALSKWHKVVILRWCGRRETSRVPGSTRKIEASE